MSLTLNSKIKNMSDKLIFAFPVSLLLQESSIILNAADKYAVQVGGRLPASHGATTRTMTTQVSLLDAKQRSDRGDLGTLTVGQNDALTVVQEKLGNARDTAKKAFKGQDVKLREEFQVGINKPGDLGSVVQRSRIVLASIKKATNADALKSKGWLPTDTTEFETAIDALDAADETQEGAKVTPTAATRERNTKANQLYESLLAVQNAANLQWPESKPANASIRAEFRIGKFPPPSRTGGKETPPAPPTPPTPPA